MRPTGPAPAVIELFCGAGGFSLGFRSAGARIVAAVDVDESAARTFLENLGQLQPDDPPFVLTGDQGDVGDMDLDRVARGGRPDILIGGPPCQGFSRVGRAKLDSLSEEGFVRDPRNELYRRFLDAAAAWHPRAVVMENVPGMLTIGGRNIADEAAADLSKLGYRTGYCVLNAAWYGVPQYRERLFFIGLRDDLKLIPAPPRPTHRVSLPAGYLRPRDAVTLPLPFITHYDLSVAVDSASWEVTTVVDALQDLPVLTEHLRRKTTPSPRGDFRRSLSYHAEARSPYAWLMRNWPRMHAGDTVTDHAIRWTPRDFETFRLMRPGDRYPEALRIARERFREELHVLGIRAPASGTLEYQELERRFVPPYSEASFVDKWRKLIPDEPSWTVPAHLSKDAYSHIHYDDKQARAISVREAARLQSFPDRFHFCGNMGECFRQVGNAVPPLVAWALADALLRQLGYQSRPIPWAEASVAVSARKGV